MTALSMQQRLDDAKSQYHQLLTGQLARVVVDRNGDRVEFTSASRASLKTYIDELERTLGTPADVGPAIARW